jgi:hypothetical protein
MEEKVEPLAQEDEIKAISGALKNIGYTVLDYRTDLDNSGIIPSGIIDIRIIPSRMFL